MATFTATPANFTNSSDANFRLWGSYIGARLEAVGIIKTADTGQIDWVTVLTPAGINTYSGYEIRQFTDALQATAPVFIKIQYGEGNSADGPGVRVQFGSGSNGSGTLTGNLSSEYDAEMTPSAAACTVFGSGDTNRFVICAGYIAAVGVGFAFERSRNSAGAVTSEAVIWTAHSTAAISSGAAQTAVWSTTLGVLGATETDIGALFPAGATAASGVQTMVMPVFHSKGVFMNPGLNCVGYYTENIAINSTISAYMYGAAHTYFCLPTTAFATTTAFRGAGGGTESLAILYE